MTGDLFESLGGSGLQSETLGEGATVLRGFALPRVDDVLAAISKAAECAPFRRMLTPGGQRMSVEMTNCGSLGWVTDRKGYRYEAEDPESAKPWAPMPDSLRRLANEAAASAGFSGFAPDACLINRYAPGTRMSLHQDRDEQDFGAPIVSVSLGLPIVFLFGGLSRADKSVRVPLMHGDVVVWGGAARLRYHGVMPLKDGYHSVLGACRINLTFRKAG